MNFAIQKDYKSHCLPLRVWGPRSTGREKKWDYLVFVPPLPHPRTSIRGSQATELDNYRQKENQAFLFKHLVRNFCLTKS